jgi:hypothetical protein
MTATFCGSCGFSLERDAAFCNECGAPVVTQAAMNNAASVLRNHQSRLPPPPGRAPPPPSMGGHKWLIRIPGQADVLADLRTLQACAKDRRIRSETTIINNETGAMYTARQIPDVFSDKDFTTALLLSIFLGGLGIDRFYLGYTGLGIAKLLTLGGLGIWSLVDMIMIATRNVGDVQGRALA